MKENREDSIERMKKLNKSLDSNSEVYIGSASQEDNKERIDEEYRRLTELASDNTNANFKENYYKYPGDSLKSQGKTVNSMFEDMYGNPQVNPEPVRQPLQADEAFDLAIKRTLKSGAPVDDMPFYDEINLNLMKLGFPPKLPLDIKNRILKMLSPDEK